jgi:hypothetical protein
MEQCSYYKKNNSFLYYTLWYTYINQYVKGGINLTKLFRHFPSVGSLLSTNYL